METAKLFWSGRSQAVRLPKEFRVDGSEARIRRRGDHVMLEPTAKYRARLDALMEPMDEDFARAVNEQAGQQQRPELDESFP